MADQAPIIVTPSAIGDALSTATRIAVTLGGGGTAVMGFIGAHNFAGLALYFQSDSFYPVAGAIAAAASLGYELYRTYRTKKSLVAVANAVPDSLATVKPLLSLKREKPDQ